MATLLMLRFDRDLPLELSKSLGAYCRVSGPELSVFDIENAPVREIVRSVLPYKRWLIFGPYFVPEADVGYDSADIVGFVLGPGEVQGSANSPSDFDPTWPPPCKGIVKHGVAIECRFKPKGHVEMIGNNFIFSKPILRLLGSDTVGRSSHAVQLKGKLLENWTGFEFQERCSVISPISYDFTTNCALCNSSITPWRGVWLGDSGLGCDVEVCSDLLGGEHHGTRHPVVVSKKLAKAIKKALGGSGLNLEPIHDLTSDYGIRIVSICSMLCNEEF